MKLFIYLILAVITLSIGPKIYNKIELKELETIQAETLEIAKINPNSHHLPVDFICQAPLQTEANWIKHEESCEEAALLQAINYQRNIEMTAQEADKVILDMITWQTQHFGSHKDLYATDMRIFISGYYQIPLDKILILQNPGVEELKKHIANGKPIIIGITGELLKNPYYPYPGYHMLLLIGYTEDRFITNDNGTRRGANYSYEIETFMKAFQDAGSVALVLDI